MGHAEFNPKCLALLPTLAKAPHGLNPIEGNHLHFKAVGQSQPITLVRSTR